MVMTELTKIIPKETSTVRSDPLNKDVTCNKNISVREQQACLLIMIKGYQG